MNNTYLRVLVFLLNYVLGLYSPDCSNLISLASSLNLNTKQPLVWSQLQSDCCTASGIQCAMVSESYRVLQVSWANMELDGVIDGNAIPSELERFGLFNNKVSGSIPANLPSKLAFVTFQQNRLSGNIPSTIPASMRQLVLNQNLLVGSIPENLPNSLEVLWLSSNLLTGLIPSNSPAQLRNLDLSQNRLVGPIPSNFPRGLMYIELSSNQLNGSIPSTLPQNLQGLSLGQNQLTGTIPSIPPSLRTFDIHSNYLVGILPVIPNTVLELLVYNNSLSGDLPQFNNIGSLYLGYPGLPGNRFTGGLQMSNVPMFVFINDNWLTDIVLSSSNLQSCDISNNPLLGNPHIVNLGICTKNNLYNSSLLPNSMYFSATPGIDVPNFMTGLSKIDTLADGMSRGQKSSVIVANILVSATFQSNISFPRDTFSTLTTIANITSYVLPNSISSTMGSLNTNSTITTAQYRTVSHLGATTTINSEFYYSSKISDTVQKSKDVIYSVIYNRKNTAYGSDRTQIQIISGENLDLLYSSAHPSAASYVPNNISSTSQTGYTLVIVGSFGGIIALIVTVYVYRKYSNKKKRKMQLRQIFNVDFQLI